MNPLFRLLFSVRLFKEPTKTPFEKLLSELVDLHDKFDHVWRTNQQYISQLEELLKMTPSCPHLTKALGVPKKENDKIRKKLLAISEKIRKSMRRNPSVMTTGDQHNDECLRSCVGIIPLPIVGQALTYMVEHQHSKKELSTAA